MKKIVFASIVLLYAFFTSCTKSDLAVAPDGSNTLSAVMENSDSDGSSRTTLDYGRNVVWSAGDKLSVFNKDDQKQQAEYTLIQGAGTIRAVFQSDKPLGEGVKYAFYPASTGATCAAGVMSFNLPDTQPYTQASFANGSNPMVAKSNAQGDLSFQNLCGVIKFQLTGTATVARVVMQTAGEVVAGAMKVKMDYTGAPALETANTNITSITLTDCNVSLSESVNSTFYFTVPAATYAPGLTFTAYDGAGKMIRSRYISKPLTVSRSRIASLTGVSDKVSFPDARFRAILVAKGFKLTGDGSDIDITNAENITKFQTLPTLDVSTTTSAGSGAVSRATTPAKITSLKGIEYFTALTSLTCTGNDLTRLDVSANKELVTLECADNTALGYLDCSGTKLKVLNVKNNQNMDTIRCPDNQLETLKLPSQSQLIYLDCSGNKKLTDLDVSANTALKHLNCSGTTLKVLNVQSNQNLDTIQCSDNQLQTLEITQNNKLTYLNCGSNPLTGLNVSANTALKYLDCSGNTLKVLNVQSNQNLDTIRCSDNELTILELPSQSQLVYLDCSGNKLTGLDVSASKALKHLDCSGIKLKVLNVKNNQNLDTIRCSDNQLTILDIKQNNKLTYLECVNNKLTDLDVSKNTALKYLNCRRNWISTLDITALRQLTDPKNLMCGGQTTDDGKTLLQLTLRVTGAQNEAKMGTGEGNEDVKPAENSHSPMQSARK